MTTNVSLKHVSRRLDTPAPSVPNHKRLKVKVRLDTGGTGMTATTARLDKVEAIGSREAQSHRVVRESRAPFVPKIVVGNKDAFVKKQALKTDTVGQSAIAKAPKEPTCAWKSNEYMYFAGDISGVPRLTASLVNTIQGKPDPAGLQGLGLTSALSVLTGYVAAERGYNAYQEAEKIGDTTGQITGAINMVRGPMEMLGGLTFTPFRALSIAATYTSAKSVTVAAGIFANVGSAFFALTYILLMIPSIMALYENISFHRELYEVMEAPENKTEAEKYHAGLKFLIDTLNGTEKDWEKTVKDLLADHSIVENGVVKVAPEVDPEELKLLSQEELDYIDEEIDRAGFDIDNHPLMIAHAQAAFIKMKKRLEVEFSRKTGPEALSLIKKAEPLLELLKVGQGVEMAKELFSKIDTEKWKNRILHGALIFFCAVGVFALIAGMVASGGTLGIVIAAAWVVTTVGMLAIDGYFLYEAYKSGSLDTKDKLFFMVGTLILSIAAGAGIVFSGGLAPLIIAGVVGGIWMIYAGYSYMKWREPAPTAIQPVVNKVAIQKAEEEEALLKKRRALHQEHVYSVEQRMLA